MGRNKKQKIMISIAGLITLANIILVAAFLVYLYFWIKRNS